MKATEEKILKGVERMEAYADRMKKEATQIREMLGVVSTTPNPKRERFASSSAIVLSRREQTRKKSKI